jgi:hypothetical protein
MTPADKRIAELIERWLASVDLHLQYVDLSPDQYSEAQAWPKHDRPSRWVLELARQKVLELKAQCESRVSMGDGKFAESLELMAFLANLVGSQHIQRFIPLASPNKPAAAKPKGEPRVPATPAKAARTSDPDATREMPKLNAGSESTREMPKIQASTESTREMPKLKAPPAPARSKPSPEPKADRAPAKAETKKPVSRPAPTAVPAAAPANGNDLEEKIVADAIRLMRWGRQWHEIAELIARIADRPNIGEVRRILRTHRATIETQVGAEA